MDKTLMSENPRETADDVMITVNLAFRNWLVQSGKLVEAYVHRNNPEVGEQLVAQFLRDRPEYKKYIEKYTSMMQQQHFRDFMKEKSSYDPKMIIEKGKLTREWAYNTTINGTEFTVFCKQYELEVNGKTQITIKAEYYNSEGIMIMDPYVGVWVYPYYAWFGWWLIMYGEDDYLYVWYTYPDPNEADPFYTQVKLKLSERTYEAVINTLFCAVIGLAKFAGAVVAGLLSLAGPAMQTAENMQFGDATDFAYADRVNNNWGMRPVTYVHYIYPWTVFYWLTSYFSIDYVLSSGVWIDALPNSQTQNLILVTIFGVGLGYVIGAPRVGVISTEIRNWANEHGYYTWVWVGPYQP